MSTVTLWVALVVNVVCLAFMGAAMYTRHRLKIPLGFGWAIVAMLLLMVLSLALQLAGSL